MNVRELIKKTRQAWRKAKDDAEVKALRAGDADVALELHKCRLFDSVETLPQLMTLMQHPAAIEFMTSFMFPGIDIWHQWNNVIDTTIYGIYVDRKRVSLHNPRHRVLYFVGDTHAELFLDMTFGCTVVALSGAKVNISANKYAVVKIESDKTSNINAEKKDNAIIL